MDTPPQRDRPELVQLADEAVAEFAASEEFATYQGGLPPPARERLARISLKAGDEAMLEDLVAERMIELTRNADVQEAGDDDFDTTVLARSYDVPVMVDVYSSYCRPCTHILPVVYQLAAQYRAELAVVKINISQNPRFRSAYLGLLQVTPAFLFFRGGRPVRTGGWLARLFGQRAVIAQTRAGLERRIQSVLGI